MLKRDELADPNSCLNKAADDEYLFVLRSKDPEMANTIREWAARRIQRGMNKATDAKIIEALQLAQTVDRLHRIKVAPMTDEMKHARRERRLVEDPVPVKDGRSVWREATMLNFSQAEALNGRPEEIPMAGGKVKTSKIPRWELIPTAALDSIASIFELGIVRKGDGAWNALSDNQEILTDIDFLINRLAHIMRHAALIRDQLKATGTINAEDAGALGFGGVLMTCAAKALHDAGWAQSPTTDIIGTLKKLADQAAPALDNAIQEAMNGVTVDRTTPTEIGQDLRQAVRSRKIPISGPSETLQRGENVASFGQGSGSRENVATLSAGPSEPLRPGDRNYVDPHDAIGLPKPDEFCKACGGNHDTGNCPVDLAAKS